MLYNQPDGIAAPNQYTQITFPIKALKLLLKDVQTVGPKGSTSNGKRQDLEVEGDDGVSLINC